MSAAQLVIGLVAELGFLLLALGHGDLSQRGNPGALVAALLAAGGCFLFAVSRWPTDSRRAGLLLWGGAILFRLVLLPMTPGDDYWRYAWEGRVQNAGFNPYLLAPDAPALAPWRDADWAKINHREVAAIYPPAAELTFRALALCPAPLLLFKALFIAADLLTLALLLRLLPGPDAGRRAAWYALNPAVLYAFAGAAHYDSLMVCALTGALCWAVRATDSPAPGWRPALLCAGCLGVAIAFKIVPIFLLPVFACALRRRAPALILALALPAALALPFGGLTVLRPLRDFAAVTRFNDLTWWAIEHLTGPNPFGRNWPFTTVLLLTTAGLAWQWRADWRRGALWVFGAALLLSPVLHPWYATWLLPLAIWRQAPAWTILSLSALTALLLWETTPLWQAWQPNTLTHLMVILPPLAWWVALRQKRSTFNVQRSTFNGLPPSDGPR